MLVSDIYIDLPSEEIQRAQSGWDAFKSWVGQPDDPGTGREQIIVDTAEVFGKLVNGFKLAGLTNVISLMVDEKVVFIDEDAQEDDLETMVRQVAESGALVGDIADLRLVLETENQGIHFVLDLEICTSVQLGREEIHLEVSGRIDELNLLVGETALAYDQRIRAFAADWDKVEGYIKAIKRFSELLKLSLKRALPYCPLRSGDTYLQLIAPQDEQIGRFRDLVFGETILKPEYRPAPMVERRGFFADRFLYFYYDPYFNLLNWILVDSMVDAGCLREDDVRVVEPGGVSLFKGSEFHSKKYGFGWRPEAVTYDQLGRLRVSERIGAPVIIGDPLSDYSRFTPVNPTAWK